MLELAEELLPSLLPLLKRRDTYYCLAIALLAFLLWQTKVTLGNDNAALAARANVTTHAQVQTKTVLVAGPVRTETKTVFVPGTKTIEYIDRVVLQEPATTTTETASVTDRAVTAACPAAAKAPWRSAGVLWDPAETSKVVGVRGALTLFKNFEIGAQARFAPRAEGALETSVRF